MEQNLSDYGCDGPTAIGLSFAWPHLGFWEYRSCQADEGYSGMKGSEPRYFQVLAKSLSVYQWPETLVNLSSGDCRLSGQPTVVVIPLRACSSWGALNGSEVQMQRRRTDWLIVTCSQVHEHTNRWQTEGTYLINLLVAARTAQSSKYAFVGRTAFEYPFKCMITQAADKRQGIRSSTYWQKRRASPTLFASWLVRLCRERDSLSFL